MGAVDDWTLTVVPDGAFLVLVAKGRVSEDELQQMKRGIPAGLRDRVLLVEGMHFQVAS